MTGHNTTIEDAGTRVGEDKMETIAIMTAALPMAERRALRVTLRERSRDAASLAAAIYRGADRLSDGCAAGVAAAQNDHAAVGLAYDVAAVLTGYDDDALVAGRATRARSGYGAADLAEAVAIRRKELGL